MDGTSDLNLAVVEELGGVGASLEEIAAVLGCSLEAVREAMAHDTRYQEAYREGMAKVKTELRNLQIKAAREGNVEMLIWLGKQLLGQSEPPGAQVTDASRIIDNIAGARERAGTAGDYAAASAADAALARIGAGEDPTVVYAELLRASPGQR
jgi:hypothetical protein